MIMIGCAHCASTCMIGRFEVTFAYRLLRLWGDVILSLWEELGPGLLLN